MEAVQPSATALEKVLRSLRAELGHGDDRCLELEFRMAHLLAQEADFDGARLAFEEVLIHRAAALGDQNEVTARVACDLFNVLCELGERAAMAEVYYRFLWWLPVRNPLSLSAELRGVMEEVEGLIEANC